MILHTLQHTATSLQHHCNTTATHYKTLQLKLQYTATRCNITAIHAHKQSGSTEMLHTLQHNATPLQHTATHCNTLQHIATHCNTLQHTATHCNTLQHTATATSTHCNTLQHTATHCNTLQHTHTNRVDQTICHVL